MKDGWEIKKLKEIAEIISGQSPESSYYNTSKDGLPFYQGKIEFTKKYIAPPKIWTSKITKQAIAGDILMSVRAPVGPTNFATEDCCIGRGLAAIRVGNTVDREFLYLYFQTIEEKLKGKEGAVFNSLTRDQIKNIDIPLPPLSEQKEIVALLDDVLSRIDKARENIEKNIENAKELYENAVEQVFTDCGEIYGCVKLSDVCHYDKIKNTTPNLPYVGLEHIESNTGRFLGNLTPTDVLSSTFYFSNTHLLYGRLRPYLNKALLPTFEGHCSTEIFPISVHEEIMREYLFYWITAKSIMKRIDKTWTGARMPRANMTQVLEFEIPLPPLSKQQEIVSTLGILRDDTELVKTIYTKKLQALDELRNSVLEKAFRGELT
ncbi:MAG TPA: restriction endonuclease subunit S [Methanocorpusculum sp.]|nr:restriction endonuclease subunit S [Methanocorpusculum sp.]HJJ81081.1 restriction endonuclease subunit S [Methanocorpusculum sp.]